MNKELELWHFIASRLKNGGRAILLVVAESTGSSPGRAGYKMVVSDDGELCGSIGGGVMEVNLVEQSRAILSGTPAVAGGLTSVLIEQEHRKNSKHPSGMICSGRQTVILKELSSNELEPINGAIAGLQQGEEPWLIISDAEFKTLPDKTDPQNRPLPSFERIDDTFQYIDKLGPKNDLYIIGGGHCSLALSELMSRLDFRIRVFDDRSDLSTLKKNDFAHHVTILDRYDRVGHQILEGDNVYVVVMTLGYKSDETVIRQLIGKDFKYFGVLGSKAKMAMLLKDLRDEGFPGNNLEKIHAPVGLSINSHTPEEIAVSIAAEIISIKNR